MKVISITEYEVLFDNGHRIVHYHEQDCCEFNYADFTSLKDTTFETDEHADIDLEEVINGVRINGHFVPCYSVQNGYYSDDVSIQVVSNDGVVIKEIVGYGELID